VSYDVFCPIQLRDLLQTGDFVEKPFLPPDHIGISAARGIARVVGIRRGHAETDGPRIVSALIFPSLCDRLRIGDQLLNAANRVDNSLC
jgi:hypothetical protein